MAKLIFGCGYLGLRVASLWRQRGEAVLAVTRSPLRAKELETIGLVPIVARVTELHSLAGLPQVDAVLYAIGYDRSSGESMRQVYVDGLANVLDSLPASVEKLVYISSTGVYGHSAGEAVDERSPCKPEREGGRVCLEAEETLRSHALGSRSIVLRMAGIYGPGRIPRREAVAKGRPVMAPAEGKMNLIHVDDAAEIVVHCAEAVAPPELYCVSDGHPVARRDYFRHLARLIGAPEPTFSEPEPSDAVAQRARGNKRVVNAKLMAMLGRPLRHPSYREGLASILERG